MTFPFWQAALIILVPYLIASALDVATTVRAVRAGAVETNPFASMKNGKVNWPVAIGLKVGLAALIVVFVKIYVTAAVVMSLVASVILLFAAIWNQRKAAQ
jgi:hypothetical protein